MLCFSKMLLLLNISIVYHAIAVGFDFGMKSHRWKNFSSFIYVKAFYNLSLLVYLFLSCYYSFQWIVCVKVSHCRINFEMLNISIGQQFPDDWIMKKKMRKKNISKDSLNPPINIDLGHILTRTLLYYFAQIIIPNWM